MKDHRRVAWAAPGSRKGLRSSDATSTNGAQEERRPHHYSVIFRSPKVLDQPPRPSDDDLMRASGRSLVVLACSVTLFGCPKDQQFIPKEVCGVNLHDDDSTCKNATNEIGELCLEPAFSLPIAAYTYSHNNLAVADFNGDGHIDVRVGSDIYAGLGDGKFAEIFVRPGPSVGSGGAQVTDCAEGDFNADGISDLAYVSLNINTFGDPDLGKDRKVISIWFGNANLDPLLAEVSPDLLPLYPVRIAAADFNNDGFDDIAVPLRDWDLILCDAEIMLRKGTSFSSAGRLPGVTDGSDCPTITLFDFDNDGNVDIDTFASDLYLGDGTGKFAPRESSPRPLSPSARYGHDLNCDKLPDAIDHSGKSIAAWQGIGKALYEMANPDIIPAESVSVVSDMNGDGEPDIIAAGPSGLRILFGDSEFTFSAPFLISAEATYVEVEIADFNEDQRLDLAALGESSVDIFLSHP